MLTTRTSDIQIGLQDSSKTKIKARITTHNYTENESETHHALDHFLQLTQADYDTIKTSVSLGISVEELLYEMHNAQIELDQAELNEVVANPEKTVLQRHADINKAIERLLGKNSSHTNQNNCSPVLQLSSMDLRALYVCSQQGYSTMSVLELLISDQMNIDNLNILETECNDYQKKHRQFVSLSNTDPLFFFKRLASKNDSIEAAAMAQKLSKPI